MIKQREEKTADILRSAEDMTLNVIKEEDDEYCESRLDQSHERDEFHDFEELNPKISFKKNEANRIIRLEDDMKRIEESISKHKKQLESVEEQNKMHEWASRRQQEIDDIEDASQSQDLLWIPVNNSLKKDQIRKTKADLPQKREVKGDLLQFETKDFMHKDSNKSPSYKEEQQSASSDQDRSTEKKEQRMEFYTAEFMHDNQPMQTFGKYSSEPSDLQKAFLNRGVNVVPSS